MDPEKYNSNAKIAAVEELPVHINLFDEIKKGNIGFLLDAFTARKTILMQQIRKGSAPADIARWQACISALEAACTFLTNRKVR